MDEILICNLCPCRHEDICIKAGYNNGQEFGDALRRKIAEAKRNNKGKSNLHITGTVD